MKDALNNKEQIMAIKRQMYAGEITYDEAKVLAKPFIDDINQRGAIVAKKYGVRAKKVSFAGVMR